MAFTRVWPAQSEKKEADKADALISCGTFADTISWVGVLVAQQGSWAAALCAIIGNWAKQILAPNRRVVRMTAQYSIPNTSPRQDHQPAI
jgi:hypothetical protein